jgi:predicted unusual protein kinase regulating ubiquinone biosynthesis (AarF/ABC1/UbiB family)
MKKPTPQLLRIKTGKLERQMSLAGIGAKTGARAATQLFGNAFTSKDKRKQRRQEIVARNAHLLAEDLGKLKGGVVKVGQVMALYGEHVLPAEVALAFRTLEEQTVPVCWAVIESVIKDELHAGVVDAMTIDENVLGAASLSQVHRATLDGRELCLKIQYPGVADAIDTDLDAVTRLLRMAKLVKMGEEVEAWLEEVRRMLHREVDYKLEAQTTIRFARRLQNDPILKVPEVLPELSTEHILVETYEPGFAFNAPEVAALSQVRRNRLADAFLHLFFKEVFVWEELQTDPNFGNYRVQIDDKGDQDKLVLLDFGAVCSYPSSFFEPLKAMIRGAYRRDEGEVIAGVLGMSLLSSSSSEKTRDLFVKLLIGLIEPLNYRADELETFCTNSDGAYRWKHSKLPKRMGKMGASSAFSKDFEVPPKEFAFISRKLLGVYGVLSALDAELAPPQWLNEFLN